MGGSDPPKSFGQEAPCAGFREAVMEKNRFSKEEFFEWWDNNGRSRWKRRNEKRREKGGPGNRETPEEMIRSLQGIFCKGRYRSVMRG